MAYNGSGTFLINTAGQPVVAGTVISSTTFNSLTADLATGLSTVITKDGQTTVTANIPMASFKFTGLGVGSAAGDSANLSQVQSTVTKLLASVSGADTVTATASPTLAAYAAGQMFYFVAAGDNTTSVTLNIDALGAKAVTRDGSVALAAADIKSGEVVVVVYDGTRFQVVSQLNSAGNATFANVSITSALNVGGVATFSAGSAAAPSITTTGDTNTGLFFPAADTIGFTEGGVEAGRFDSSGNFNIGTTTVPGSNGGGIAIFKSDYPRLTFRNTTTGDGATDGTQFAAVGANFEFYNKENGNIEFGTNNTERMRLDSSGNLGIGTASPSFKLDVSGTSNVLQTTSSNGINNFYQVTSSGTTVLQNDQGAYAFYTGGGEKLRLTTSGDLGIGTASPAARLDVVTSGPGLATFTRDLATDVSFNISADNDGTICSTGGVHNMRFFTNSAERARITSAGDLLVGQTAGGYSNSNSMTLEKSAGYCVFNHLSGTSSGTKYHFFVLGGTEIGSITQNGTTAVAYNTSSDYRLKDNPQPLTNSGAFIDALQPKTWDWKTDGSRGVGFIAHEVQAVSPGSVVGEKDAVDADGKPAMQAMEYGSAEFIANIVAELQSLRKRVAELESK